MLIDCLCVTDYLSVGLESTIRLSTGWDMDKWCCNFGLYDYKSCLL